MNKKLIISCITLILISCIYVGVKVSDKVSNLNFSKASGLESKSPGQNTQDPEDRELKTLNKVNDRSDYYKKEVILELSYGKEDHNLGIEKRETDIGEVYDVPQAMDIDKDGNIYVADPVNKAIKVYSKEGKYLNKIELNNNDLLKDFGIDSLGNIYVIGEKKLYKKNFDENLFTDIVYDLNEPHEVVVSWSGNVSVLDYSGLSDNELRVQKFDSKGKLMKKVQNTKDFSMYEYEDLNGNTINFSKTEENVFNPQYRVSKNISNSEDKQEFIYPPYLPDGYFLTQHEFIGCDDKDNIYMVRSIAPDSEDSVEAYEREETWIDIIDFKAGEINSVKIEKRKDYGGIYRTNHMYKVDTYGNVFQMQSGTDNVKIIKYSIKE